MLKLAAIGFFGAAFALTTFAQTTSFVYQGQLTDSSLTPSANYSMEFRLFTSADGATQVGPTVSLPAVQVTNGIFSADLNFGNNFDGTDRYLEIRVGATILSPRQRISSAPYAIKSLAAGVADNANMLGGQPPSGFIQNGSGPQASTNFNISGIGKANIFDAATHFSIGGIRALAVTGGGSYPAGNTMLGTNAGIALQPATDGNISGNLNTFVGEKSGQSTTTGFGNSFFGNASGMKNTIGIGNVFIGGSAGVNHTQGSSNTFLGDFAGSTNTVGSNNTALGYSANVSSNNLSFSTAVGSGAVVSTNNTVALGRNVDVVQVPGSLGIRTAAPLSALDVRGDIRLGTSGQYMATAATENLRIVRGTVSGAGGILTGTGTYTVSHTLGTGVYVVTFSNAFTALPSITATAESGAGAARLVTLQNVSASSATFNVFIPNTLALVDGAFHFIALGPR
jgi:hypothetical protein